MHSFPRKHRPKNALGEHFLCHRGYTVSASVSQNLMIAEKEGKPVAFNGPSSLALSFGCQEFGFCLMVGGGVGVIRRFC